MKREDEIKQLEYEIKNHKYFVGRYKREIQMFHHLIPKNESKKKLMREQFELERKMIRLTDLLFIKVEKKDGV